MFRKEKQKGITLISLVITIIILLILAAVAISIAVDSNGLFAKAGDAANKWNTSVASEGTTINNLLEIMDEVSKTVKPMVTRWNVAAGDKVVIGLYAAEYDGGNELSNTTEVTIDWGDGTIEHYTSSNLQYNELENGYITHTYETANANAKVTITGKCNKISMHGEPGLVAIEEWGETETVEYSFWNCENLATIASPETNTFSNVTSFLLTFCGCKSLRSIPADLFANCPNVECFVNTFNGCISLTGNAIPLWERVKDGEENDYHGTPEGEGCYYDCTGLTGYNSIPEYWRKEPAMPS